MAGSTTVPAHTLYDIVRKLPDGAQVSLEGGGEATQLLVRSGRSRFTLQTLPPSDFPDLAAGEFPHRFELKGADLRKLIEKTQFAISTEETRYYLNGIYLHTLDVDGEQRHARRRDRRPSPGARRARRAGRAPPACPASSCRARPSARSRSCSTTATRPS